MTTRRGFLSSLAALCAVPLVPQLPKPERIAFDLSPEEAQALANIVSGVAGDPRFSQRKYIDQIHHRLAYEGYRFQWGNVRSGDMLFRREDQLEHVLPYGKDHAFMLRWRKSFNRDGTLR